MSVLICRRSDGTLQEELPFRSISLRQRVPEREPGPEPEREPVPGPHLQEPEREPVPEPHLREREREPEPVLRLRGQGPRRRASVPDRRP